MEQEYLTRIESQAYLKELEQARVKFFHKFFKVHPNDPGSYHAMLNLGQLDVQSAAEVVVRATTDKVTRYIVPP